MRSTFPMIESFMAVRLSIGCCSSTALLQYRPLPSVEEGGSCFHVSSRRIFHSQRIKNVGSGFLKYTGDYFPRKHLRKNRTQATAEHLDSASEPKKENGRARYHPSEDIRASALQNNGDARLSPAETTRTIIEVNNKGTLMLSGLIGDGVHENILCPDIPYITDQNGSIYFQVKGDEDILQTITSDSNYVQVIVGFDTMEMIKEMELMDPSEIDFGIEEIEDEESEVDDEDEGGEDEGDDEEDWVAVLDDEEDEEDDDDDEDDSDESLGDWANLETMRTCHPMYFARRMTEVASNDPVDWMEQPSAGLAIQGLLRRVFVEDNSDIQKDITHSESPSIDENDLVENLEEKVDDVGTTTGDEPEINAFGDKSSNSVSYYKLEMIKIQLITAQGDQTEVEVEDVRKAQPDAIAHASAGIIRRLEEGGEILTQALKTLCWRHNGIQAEEVKLIGIDSLGFDLRVCSGTQIDTLRYAFSTRAITEQCAERQLKEILFPTILPKPQKPKRTHQKEC